MALNVTEIQSLAELQVRSHNLQAEIDFTQNLIVQLMSDRCQAQITFLMHNSTRCEKNKARVRVAAIEEGQPQYRLFQLPQPHPGCQSQLVYQFGESTAIRILNTILEEKRKEKTDLATQMETLLQKLEPAAPTYILNQQK